jgi:hypothetical protein
MMIKNSKRSYSKQSFIRQTLLIVTIFVLVSFWDSLINSTNPFIISAWIISLSTVIYGTQKVVTLLLKQYHTPTTTDEPTPTDTALNITPTELATTLNWLRKFKEELETKTDAIKDPQSPFQKNTSSRDGNVLLESQNCAVVVTTDIYNPKSYIIPTNDTTNMYQMLNQQDSILKVTDFLQEKGFETKVLKYEGERITVSPLNQSTAKNPHPIQFPTNIFTLN